MNQNKKGYVPPTSNVQNSDILYITVPLINRMTMRGLSEKTITSYTRSVEKLVRFNHLIHPKDLDIDQVLDFLCHLIDTKRINWRTNKMYVAGLRYYWTEILEDSDFAARIPYPKEVPSLPKILSRKELNLFFNSCNNLKHRVIFRLIYSSGLRRSELLNLKIHDIETADGKFRIRINNAKGNKDRDTVLSKLVLLELRTFFTKYQPKVYLFNGRKKGLRLSEGALSHAIKDAHKRSGITKSISMHVLRHCFATHALEHGMYIKRLQQLLGHSSLQTTLIYLQVSEVPHTNDFSPLYKLLSSCTQKTILEFGKDSRQKMHAKVGGISILHTWNQRLDYHPHIHMIVPAGGINKSGHWISSRGKDNFLFHVKALSKTFRGKFLAGLHHLHKKGDLTLPPNWNINKYYLCKDELYKTSWNVYAKQAFGGPQQVLEYLARYTHKIAISNYRILKITDTHVTFRYADRKAKKTKNRTLTGVEFVRLFSKNILPKGFFKIRHFGFLSSRCKTKYLALVRKSLGAPSPPVKFKMTTRQFIIQATGEDPYTCPSCQKGEMVVVKIIPAIRGSPQKIPMSFFASDKKVQLI